MKGRLLRVALCVCALALALAAPAGADQNDPSAVEAAGPGVVSSRQAARVAGAGACQVRAGGPASVASAPVGVPTQRVEEVGPEWVGSDAWRTSVPGGSSFDGGMAMQGAATGPQCG